MIASFLFPDSPLLIQIFDFSDSSFSFSPVRAQRSEARIFSPLPGVSSYI